jgi:hypothetical protein
MPLIAFWIGRLGLLPCPNYCPASVPSNYCPLFRYPENPPLITAQLTALPSLLSYRGLALSRLRSPPCFILDMLRRMSPEWSPAWDPDSRPQNRLASPAPRNLRASATLPTHAPRIGYGGNATRHWYWYQMCGLFLHFQSIESTCSSVYVCEIQFLRADSFMQYVVTSCIC